MEKYLDEKITLIYIRLAFCHTFTLMSYSPLLLLYVCNVPREEQKCKEFIWCCMGESYLRLKPVGTWTNRTTRSVTTRNQFLIWKVSFVEPCRPEWIIYHYELITQNMDWMAAQRYCRSRSSNTHLLQIDHRNQQLALTHYLSSISCMYKRLSVCLSVLLY